MHLLFLRVEPEPGGALPAGADATIRGREQSVTALTVEPRVPRAERGGGDNIRATARLITERTASAPCCRHPPPCRRQAEPRCRQ
jgi:hypothetical protein